MLNIQKFFPGFCSYHRRRVFSKPVPSTQLVPSATGGLELIFFSSWEACKHLAPSCVLSALADNDFHQFQGLLFPW